MGTRIAEWLAATMLGVIVGFIGTFGHQLTWTLFGAALPVGLVAGLIAVGALVAGIRIALASRTLAALAAFGIVLTIFLLAALGGNSGSALLPANLAGTAWSVAPTVIAAVILGWPSLRSPRSAPSGSAPAE